MSNEDKIKNKQYAVYRKSTITIGVVTGMILVLAFVYNVIAESVRKQDSTFNSQNEKYETIKHPNTYHTKETEIQQIINSVNTMSKTVDMLNANLTKHIISQEKVNEAIGLDLQQLKQK